MPVVIWTFARIIVTFYAVINTLQVYEYLDQELHNYLEEGFATHAIEKLLNGCANTVYCNQASTNEFIVYELVDFQMSPGPVMTQVDQGVLYSVLELTPTNAIYVLSPSSGNITLPGKYEQGSYAPGVFSFVYTLGPNSWLRSCANDTKSQVCTEWFKTTGDQKSATGKEILNLRELHAGITISFEYHCKDIKCLMLVRKLELYRMKKMTDTAKMLYSHSISEKSIKLKSTVSQSFLDKGTDKGPDVSEIVRQAEQYEKTLKEGTAVPVRPDEVFTFAPETTRKPTSGKRKRPRRPTPPPVPEGTTTPESTTCRSTTVETTTVTEAPDEDDDSDGSAANKKELLKQAAKAALIAAGFGALSGLIKFLLMLAAAAKVVDEVTELGEELEKEKDSDPVMYVVYNLFQAYKTAPDSVGLWLLPALILSSIPYGMHLFWNPAMNEEGVNPWDVWQNAWHESILILRSHGPEIARADLSMLYSPVSLPIYVVPSIEEERQTTKDYTEALNSIQTNYLIDSKRKYSQWDLRETRNGLRLNVSVAADWFILVDSLNQQQRLEQRSSFPFSKDFEPYVTFLTKAKPETVLQSGFFNCQNMPGSDQTFILRYQLFAHSPDISTEICIRMNNGNSELCVPSDSDRCSDIVCKADLAPYSQTFLNNDAQVIIRVKAPFNDDAPSEPSPVILLLASPDFSDMFESEEEGQGAPCFVETNFRAVADVFPHFTHPSQFMDCEPDRTELGMIVATRILMKVNYNEGGEIKNGIAGFRTIGDWYESECALDFRSFNRFNGPPELLLLNKSKPFSVKLSDAFEGAYLQMDNKFDCVAKQMRVSFYISATSGVSADVCVYNADDPERYRCSQTNSVRSYGYPTMLFESDFEANRFDLHVKINQDNVKSGSATFMMKSLEVVC